MIRQLVTLIGCREKVDDRRIHWATVNEFLVYHRIAPFGSVLQYFTEEPVTQVGAKADLSGGYVYLLALPGQAVLHFDFAYLENIPLDHWIEELRDRYKPDEISREYVELGHAPT